MDNDVPAKDANRSSDDRNSKELLSFELRLRWFMAFSRNVKGVIDLNLHPNALKTFNSILCTVLAWNKCSIPSICGKIRNISETSLFRHTEFNVEDLQKPEWRPLIYICLDGKPRQRRDTYYATQKRHLLSIQMKRSWKNMNKA